MTSGFVASRGNQLAPWAHLLVLALCAAAAGSCNSRVREGRAASYLVIEELAAASGADPDNFSNTLASDVQTIVRRQIAGTEVAVPTIFEDIGTVQVRLAFKDPGTPVNPTTPTQSNWITVNRYRVVYRRADGRNTPGVDVPYSFDGAATFTVVAQTSATFTIVRGQAKLEPPLLALRGLGGAQIISTIAEVTFYGYDQTGAQVSVTGLMSINFADWGDPE